MLITGKLKSIIFLILCQRARQYWLSKRANHFIDNVVHDEYTLGTGLIRILLSTSRDVHFEKKNDRLQRMICSYKVVCCKKKAHQSQNHKEKHISRTQIFYVIFKSSLYVILWYSFMNRLSVQIKKTYHSFIKNTSWLADKRTHIKLASSAFVRVSKMGSTLLIS